MANSGLSGGGKEKGKKEDDCGVFEATEDGFGVEENCEYVHETVSIPIDISQFSVFCLFAASRYLFIFIFFTSVFYSHPPAGVPDEVQDGVQQDVQHAVPD